ncbi:MAG: YesL family protein [Peptostreptococcaceae bacterium]
MKLDGIAMNFCNWIWRFIQLNFYWGIFVVMGLGIFGLMPATVATFYILRKWIQGNLETPIFSTFKEVYKKEFIQSNKCGVFFLAMFIFLAFDLNILYQMEESYSTILYIIVYTVLLFVSIAFIYFFPTYVHFELSAKDYIKNSFILSLISPFQTLLIAVGLGLIAYFIKSNPGLLAYFAIVVPGYLIMHILYKRFSVIKTSI